MLFFMLQRRNNWFLSIFTSRLLCGTIAAKRRRVSVNVLCLISIILGLTVQDVAKKQYSYRIKGGTYSFAAAGTLIAVFFFLISSGGKLSFSQAFLPYSVGFSISYSLSMVFSLLAVSTGPLSLTALVVSCSLLLPTIYGLVWLQEPFSVFLAIGVILLFAALNLINFEKKGEQQQITPQWLLYVSLAFIGNGMCTVIQKAQQMACSGAYKNEFMIVSLLASSVVLFAVAALRERRDVLSHIKSGLPWYCLSGAANGMVNLLVMLLSRELAASVMFPVISAGGIVVTFLVAVVFYKENLSRWQIIGVVLGALSVVFLNL